MADDKRRAKGTGSWDTVTKKGKTYIRFRKIYEGQTKPKEFTGKTKTDVNKKIKQYEDDLKKGKIVAAVPRLSSTDLESKSFGMASEVFLNRIKITEKKGNWATLASTYENYIKPYKIDRIYFTRINRDDFEDYFAQLALKYSLSTIKKSRTFINRVFSYYNIPSLITGMKMPKDENCASRKKTADFFSLDEVELFYNTCFSTKQPGENAKGRVGDIIYTGNNIHYLLLILYTGMRVGECYGLQWGDWDRQTNTIRIQRQRINVDKSWSVETPKRQSSNRVIPLPKRAQDALGHLYSVTAYKKDTDFIVSNAEGKPVSQRTLTSTMHAVMRRAGIYRDGFGLHDLRHTYGSMLLEKGYSVGQPVDIKVISELLGHKDISTTMNIYIHILQKHKG